MTTNFSDPHSTLYDFEINEHIPEICSPCRNCPNADGFKNLEPCRSCAAPVAYDLFLCGEGEYADIPEPMAYVKQDRKKLKRAPKKTWSEIAEQKGFDTVYDMFENYRVRRKMGYKEMAKVIGRSYDAVRKKWIELELV